MSVKPSKARVYLDPTDSLLAEMDRLVQFLGMRGRKDLLAEAVTLYAIMVEETNAGRGVGVYDPRTTAFIRIITPGLRSAKGASK